MSKRINYIAIALTTKCNCNCFYCKETGESILPSIKGTWNFDDLKTVISVAYSVGLTTFRITGGEPIKNLNILYKVNYEIKYSFFPNYIKFSYIVYLWNKKK